MKSSCITGVLCLALALPSAQAQSLPIFLGPAINFLPPASDKTGTTIAFGSSVTPQGNIQNTIDLYAGGRKLVPNVTSAGLATDGSRAVFTDVEKDGEGVGIVDVATGSVRRVSVDTQGCIRPLALCISCFFACVATPHLTADAGKVLYAVRRSQPFFVVNSDGSGLKQLPVYSGALAPSPQRVISAGGQVVFASSAPFGPTFAASAADVYLADLDGTNIRNLTKFGNNPNIFAANATISADGNTILFETNYGGSASAPVQEGQIWAVQSDGSRLRQLTFGPGVSTSPTISADGRTGVYVQGTVLYLLRPFEDPPPFGRRVALYPFLVSVPLSPVISDDGLRVAFLLGPASASPGAVYQVNANSSNLRKVHAPPAISPRGVVSAAGAGGQPAPGGLMTVYGINFAPDGLGSAGGFPLPDTLAGLSVLANAKKLPLVSYSPWQINAQLPQDSPVQSTNFQVAFFGAVTPPEVAEVVAASPSLFAAPVKGGLFYQAAVFHAGTATPADDEHPAKAGEVLEMYGTGLGVTDPPVPGGVPSPGNPPARARVTPVVTIGRAEARVLFAGLTPGFAGLYQINIVMPAGLGAGRYGVSLRSGDQAVTSAGTISIQ